MRFSAWIIASLAVPDAPIMEIHRSPTKTVNQLLPSATSSLANAASVWLAAEPPSKADVLLLRNAFAEFYGADRNLEKSESLLSETIERWKNQPDDEQAGLYRVRGDCYMQLMDATKAFSDYNKAVQFLEGPEAQNADPGELPLALLGRARSIKSMGFSAVSREQAQQAARDYERALKLSSRENWDTDQEMLEDGATRNPYAAWEWGSMLRATGDFGRASMAHALAANAFDEIGDRARSVISLTDAGIDLVAANSLQGKELLQKAIAKTQGIEGRDVALLQRVIAKEGEGRMALAATLWDEGRRVEAESVLGDACIRLEQLQVDASTRKSSKLLEDTTRLRFSIDDDVQSRDMSCSKFKNPNYVSQKLGWPDSLQKKVLKLQTLS